MDDDDADYMQGDDDEVRLTTCCNSSNAQHMYDRTTTLNTQTAMTLKNQAAPMLRTFTIKQKVR
jgi:hypothetical protein